MTALTTVLISMSAHAGCLDAPADGPLYLYKSMAMCDYAPNLKKLKGEYLRTLADPQLRPQVTDELRSQVLMSAIEYYGGAEPAVKRNDAMVVILTQPTDLLQSKNTYARDVAKVLKEALSGDFIMPEIAPQFLEHKAEIVAYCKASRVPFSTRIAGQSKMVRNLLASKFSIDKLVRMITHEVSGETLPIDHDIFIDTLVSMSAGMQPEMSSFESQNCQKLIDDVYEILHPYSVSNKTNGETKDNESTAINLPLALAVADLDERFDLALSYMIDFFKSKSLTNRLSVANGAKIHNGSISYYPAPEYLHEVQTTDTWAVAQQAITRAYGSQLPLAQLNDYTLKLWTAFTNDDAIPYFANLLIEILKTTNQHERAAKMRALLEPNFSHVLNYVSEALNHKGVKNPDGVYIVLQQAGSGLHHLAAGVYTAYELKKRGHSDESALWAAFVMGLAYEARDFVSHMLDRTVGHRDAYQDAVETIIENQLVPDASNAAEKGFDFVKIYEATNARWGTPLQLASGTPKNAQQILDKLKSASQAQLSDIANFKIDSTNHLDGAKIGVALFHQAQPQSRRTLNTKMRSHGQFEIEN